MGFCAYFHRTWTPGYNLEYVDPNLAYKFQQKLSLAKKVGWWILFFTLVSCLIFLLVLVFRGSDGCLNNPISTDEPSSVSVAYASSINYNPISTDDPLDPTAEAYAGSINYNPSSTDDPSSEASSVNYNPSSTDDPLDPSAEAYVGSINYNPSSTDDPLDPSAEAYVDSINYNPSSTDGPSSEAYASSIKSYSMDTSAGSEEESVLNITASCTGDYFVCDKTTRLECIHKSLVCDSIQDCSNGKDESICTALSISLEKVVKSKERRKNENEGYVLVQVKGSWHPYCTNDWTVEFGSKICNFLKYQTFVNLSIIDLIQLNKKFGIQISGRGQGSSNETILSENYLKLLVLGGSKDYSPMKRGPIEEAVTESTHQDGNDCTVGYLICSK